MGNFSKFPTCPPFSMLLSDYSQINLGDSTIKFSSCILMSNGILIHYFLPLLFTFSSHTEYVKRESIV